MIAKVALFWVDDQPVTITGWGFLTLMAIVFLGTWMANR